MKTKTKVKCQIKKSLISSKIAPFVLMFLQMARKCRLCRFVSTFFMNSAVQNGLISNLHVQIATYPQMERKGNNSRINNSLNQHHLLSLQSRVSIIISQGTSSMMTRQAMIVLMIMQFKDYKLVEDHFQAMKKNKKKE